jgi:hypothetical protein
LLQQDNIYPFQAGFIFEQDSRQGAHQFMGGTRMPGGFWSYPAGHSRQMRQRAGAAVENALHVIQTE